MKPILTFVIPIRHPDNSTDWNSLIRRLSDTVASVEGQSSSNWAGVIIANQSAVLPDLGEKWKVVRVDFAPNAFHDISESERELAYSAVRIDKGKRILSGLIAADPTDFFMFVDDDDFVNRELVKFTEENSAENGWEFSSGFVWDGGGLAYLHSNFSKYCGTSHIIRSDLLQIPPSEAFASDDYISKWLGSHIFIADFLSANKTPLSKLPFPGAAYLIGHHGSHSKSKGIFRTFVINKHNLLHPMRFINHLSKLRFLSQNFKRTFTIR